MIAAAETALDRLEELVGKAGGRRRLVSVTVEAEFADPSAAAFGARLARDRWFCWEQPDRDRFALAAIGSVAEIISRGPARFTDVATDCAELARDRVSSEPDDLPAGAGPVWTGGFAFDANGAAASHWSSLPPALMVLPELALWRAGERTLLTANVLAGPGAEPAVAALRARLASLGDGGIPLADPLPGAASIASLTAPEAYEGMVADAVAAIDRDEAEKVVLAREVTVTAGGAHDAAAIFGALREVFPSCFCFCCGTPEAAFVGASPELLVRRSGAGASTVALAGSARRSADPAVDDHLGEQLRASPKDRAEHEIVVRRIQRALRPHAVWVEAAPEASLIKVANIQHLATPIRAQLSDPRSAVELAGLLHPTPAVGGEPRDAALAAIARLEDMDRGWYAGPVGWMDAAEDGEFCVALRSGLLRDRVAHLYAGAGIVAGSDPAAELAETEIKLGALLPLLAG